MAPMLKIGNKWYTEQEIEDKIGTLTMVSVCEGLVILAILVDCIGRVAGWWL